MDRFSWFFYIGIFLFISHIFCYGISLDLSYFGIFLMVVAWRKWVLWGWVNFLVWIFIVIEILSTIYRLQSIASKYLDPTDELNYGEEEEDEEKEEEEKEEEESSDDVAADVTADDNIDNEYDEYDEVYKKE